MFQNHSHRSDCPLLSSFLFSFSHRSELALLIHNSVKQRRRFSLKLKRKKTNSTKNSYSEVDTGLMLHYLLLKQLLKKLLYYTEMNRGRVHSDKATTTSNTSRGTFRINKSDLMMWARLLYLYKLLHRVRRTAEMLLNVTEESAWTSAAAQIKGTVQCFWRAMSPVSWF